MKSQSQIKILISSVIALATGAILGFAIQYTRIQQKAPDLFSDLFLKQAIAGEAAEEEGSPEKKFQTCHTAAEAYAHGALKFFNGQLCLFNVMFPHIAEDFLNKLTEKMGLNPDTSLLADDGTPTVLEAKTFKTKTVSGTVQKVVSPDTFAGTYDFLAIVKIDDATFMKMYWSGSGVESKGFLTKGGAGLRDSNEVLYIRWDRTSADQSVEVLASIMGSGHFGEDGQRDRAISGFATYNTTTKAVAVGMTEIGPRRGGHSAQTTPGCWLMYGSGVKEGAIVMNKSHSDCNADGNALTSVEKDGSGADCTHGKMDRAEISDSATTENGTGNFNTASGVALRYSCSDLAATDDSTGDPFFGNTANFDYTKTEVDAIFAVQGD